jgi:hypothetical protein
MALQNFSLSVVDGAVTTAFTIVNTLTFVQLDAEDVILTMPPAVAGNFCKVIVVSRTADHGVVRVRPDTGDVLDVKSQFLDANEAVIWEKGSSVSFAAMDGTTWAVIDVL